MKMFIEIDDDNPCYINAFNIDYILGTDTQTTIAFKGSNNKIYTAVSAQEIMKRIEKITNENTSRSIEEITRSQLLDLD